jgi:hypothetical protein
MTLVSWDLRSGALLEQHRNEIFFLMILTRSFKTGNGSVSECHFCHSVRLADPKKGVIVGIVSVVLKRDYRVCKCLNFDANASGFLRPRFKLSVL